MIHPRALIYSRHRDYWLLAAGLMSAGCQVVFGDFTLESGAGGVPASGGVASNGSGGTNMGGTGGVFGGAGSDSGGTSPLGTCSDSTPYMCEGTQILKCVSNTWQVNDSCSKAAYCNTTTGTCNKCATGEVLCGATTSSGTALSTCDDPTVGFTQHDTCKAPLYCSTTSTTCVACDPGNTRCVLDDAGVSTDEAQTCNATRTDWDSENCPGGCTVVDGKNDKCATCVAGSVVCADLTTGTSVKRVLRKCVAGGWTTTQCPNGCKDGSGTTLAACQ